MAFAQQREDYAERLRDVMRDQLAALDQLGATPALPPLHDLEPERAGSAETAVDDPAEVMQ